jgi:hypothetical protein
MSAVGAGSAFAGTSSGARSVASATPGMDSKAPQARVLNSFMALSSSLWFLAGTNFVVARKRASLAATHTRDVENH